MSFSKKFEKVFKSVLPSPFTIAVLLTFLTFVLALIFTENSEKGSHFFNLLSYWENGVWKNNMLVFAFQMMMIMVLGHALALTKFANSAIKKITKYCNNTANAAAIVTLFAILVSLFNWGLGLIFGAILARKVGEYASKKNIKLNYPLIAAAGYSGMMVFHGGLSGSAPMKVATKGHLQDDITSNLNITVPDMIPISDTIFSTMNLYISAFLIIILPISMYLLGKRNKGKIVDIKPIILPSDKIEIDAASRLDHSKIPAFILSFMILGYCGYQVLVLKSNDIDPINFINLTLLGLGILLHSNFYSFTKAINSAIGGAAGILIQFPLYFGILGIMKDSGLVSIMSDFFVNISNETTFPVFTFISGAIVNIFVPSGGGQWAIQGPIIMEAASNIGASFNKSIMALAYGDQLTNMLQPFWALPLLWITGVKAREIIPYTFYLFLIGIVIFIGGLLLF